MAPHPETVRPDPDPSSTVAEEIQLAIQRRTVTFAMVLSALYLRRQETAEGAARDRYQELYPAALGQFIDAHGGLSVYEHARLFPAGVAYTGSNEFFVSIRWDLLAFDTTAARDLDAKINVFRLKIHKYVSTRDRAAFRERVIRLYELLIASLDGEHARSMEVDPGVDPPPPSDQHLAELRDLGNELDRMWHAYVRVGTTRGQVRYLTGATAGTLAIVVVVGAFWISTGVDRGTTWPGVVAGGALGAMFSVLQRMTSGSLEVRFEAEAVTIGGVTRPIVGAISGAAVYALVEGGIVPLEVPTDEGSAWLFFAAISFLSGFSERFAQDALGSAERSFSAGPVDAESSGGAATRGSDGTRPTSSLGEEPGPGT